MSGILKRFHSPVSIAPLVVFRIVFGLMLFYSTVRFILKGWVHDLYVAPNFFFTYYGFEWIKPLSETGMYAIYFTMLLASLAIIFGLFYRYATIVFFLLFTYVELIDKTNYLNHYYFVSLVTFLLILVPANRRFSLDAYFGFCKPLNTVPSWTINIFKFQLGVVYFFAGVAKLNSHWLIEAQPLANWLKHQTDLPFIGTFFKYKFTAYAFAWVGAFYDLSIPFLLLIQKTRWFAYILVILFHVLTAIMFPIGVFPFVMIASTLIFFSADFHEKILSFLLRIFRIKNKPHLSNVAPINKNKIIAAFLVVYISVQLLLPFRYLLYPGNLFWTEQGFRFSWRVMLIEKAGYAEFIIKNKDKTGQLVVNNSDYLTPQQEKMMATQPDMILEFAHHLRNKYQNTTWGSGENTITITNPIITVNSEVSLFNTGTKPFIDPSINLADKQRGWHHKTWILPYE